MQAVAEDLVPVDGIFEDLMDFCLQCRACEAACPSLVPFGRAMEGARAELAAQRSDYAMRLRQVVVGRLVATPWLLRMVPVTLALARRTGALRLLPDRIASSVAGMRARQPSPVSIRGTVHLAQGEEIATAALLAGCVMDPWFGGVHEASIQLLRRAGYRVVVPPDQTCCGALAAHDGDTKRVRRFAARNVRALNGFDLVVGNAAGCSAHLKEYSEWAGDGGAIIADRARDITEVVGAAVEAGRLPKISVNRGAVAVQDPCHLRHVQRIVEEPRIIVAAAGYQPIDLTDDQCCGAAGLYSILRPATSHELGENKAAQVRATGSMLVASANPGCEMQLRAHLDSRFRVAHPVELYWESLREFETRSTGAKSEPE